MANPQPTHVAIPVEDVDALHAYLILRPMAEVEGLVKSIRDGLGMKIENQNDGDQDGPAE